jgi:uncharacterized membrane protein YczE
MGISGLHVFDTGTGILIQADITPGTWDSLNRFLSFFLSFRVDGTVIIFLTQAVSCERRGVFFSSFFFYRMQPV